MYSLSRQHIDPNLKRFQNKMLTHFHLLKYLHNVLMKLYFRNRQESQRKLLLTNFQNTRSAELCLHEWLQIKCLQNIRFGMLLPQLQFGRLLQPIQHFRSNHLRKNQSYLEYDRNLDWNYQCHNQPHQLVYLLN